MKCQTSILSETWEHSLTPVILVRYEKVKKMLEGSCIECPNAQCTFMIPKPDPTTTAAVLKCPECCAEWCRFCEKQLMEGESICSICNEGLRSVFQDILDAIEEAAGTMCPQCKYRGQKYLEECTHITCDCGAQFCYCCGVGKDEVDTADTVSTDINRLYGHNEEWQMNQNTRCPMWLSDFSMRYSNWPDDPYQQQKKFHQIKAQTKLIAVKSKTPDMHWNRVLELDKSLNMQVEKFLRKTFAVL